MPPSPKGLKAFFSKKPASVIPVGKKRAVEFVKLSGEQRSKGLYDMGFGDSRQTAMTKRPKTPELRAAASAAGGLKADKRSAAQKFVDNATPEQHARLSAQMRGVKPSGVRALTKVDPDLRARRELMKDTSANVRSMSSADQAKIKAGWNTPGEGLAPKPSGYEASAGRLTGGSGTKADPLKAAGWKPGPTASDRDARQAARKTVREAKQSVGFGKGQTRPKVKLEPDAQKALKEHAQLQAQIKDVEAKLRDPKHKAYATELRARRDRLYQKLK